MKLFEISMHTREYQRKDGTGLPPEALNALKKEIPALAKDETQQWNNALGLVHAAYEHCDVERPTPAMRDGWRDYEDMITLAVQCLGKYAPNQDWRVLSADSSSPPVSADPL